MATDTTRIITANNATRAALTSTLPKLAIGAPVPPEDPAFPFANVLTNDRFVKWHGIGAGADMPVVIDFGSNKTIGAVGLLGFELDEGSLFPNSWLSYAYKTYPDPVIAGLTFNGTVNITRGSGSFITDGVKVGQTVTSSLISGSRVVQTVSALAITVNSATGSGTASATFTDIVSLNGPRGIGGVGSKDDIYLLGAPISARYIRYDILFAAGNFTLGKFLAGPVTDLGIAYSAGSTETLVRNGVSNRTVSGAKTFTKTGQDTHRMEMLFSRVPQATKDLLVDEATGQTMVIVHPTLGAMEAMLADDELEATHLWASPDLWDITLKLEQLP